VEIIFGRRVRCDTPGTFRTAIHRPVIDPDDKGVVVNIFYKHSRVKQYLKDGRAMRIETVINCPRPGLQRPPAQPRRTTGQGRAINGRILNAERAGQATVLASPAFERIAHPSVTADGRRTSALRFGDPHNRLLRPLMAADQPPRHPRRSARPCTPSTSTSTTTSPTRGSASRVKT
jgi:hypothetical protein